MPDNLNDLYLMPREVTSACKNYLMHSFPVRLDGPAQVSLFAYDNGTFITENFAATAANVRISTLGNGTQLKNLVTGEIIEGEIPPPQGWNRRNDNVEDRVTFKTSLLPHSYAAFVLENERPTAKR